MPPAFSSIEGKARDAAAKVLDLTLQGQDFSQSQVQEWTDAICSQTVASCRALSGSFKYTVTCVLAQKMGGGLTVGSAACWEPSTDGCMVERWENQSILALLVLFACSM